MSISGRRTLVAVVWFLVGLLLIWRGLPYTGVTTAPDIVGLTGTDTWIALAIAVVVGIGKGMSALRKAGRRAATRIESMGERAPFWTVFSPVMYLLVLLMIGLGVALRLAPYDAGIKAWVVGILYPAVGVALILGGLLVRNAEPLPPKE